MKKSCDVMKETQDRGNNPMPVGTVNTMVSRIKEMGFEYVAISTPYDTPNAMSGPAQAKMWCDAIRAQGMKVWHRHSWASDQGWYGVPKDVSNDRIIDTKNWILANPTLFKNGDIFTPKPEPQNMGIVGINGDGNRFADKTAFNKWLRDMTVACKEAFTTLSLSVEVGFWGFDGFITCGYNNPDWELKAYLNNRLLESETVIAMGNTICADHYPPTGKPMSDFLRVFKQTWPGVKLFIGEYGTTQGGDKVTQLNGVLNDLKADLIVTGLNYWESGPDGQDVALLNPDLTINATGNAIKAFFTANPEPTPTPTPTPTPEPAPIPEINIDIALKSMEILRQVSVIVFKTGVTLTAKVNELKALLINPIE